MENVFLYAHNPKGRSATALRNTLKIKGIKKEGSRFKPAPFKTIINWGSSKLPQEYNACRVLNTPEAVGNVTNKRKFFELIEERRHGHMIPPWTTDMQVAQGWLNEGKEVVCRTVLQGSGGEGIVLADKDTPLVEAPLYTMYVPKKSEWRLHFYNPGAGFHPVCTMFDVQRKVKAPDVEEPASWKIRNHSMGFIFQRNGLDVPDIVSETAAAVFDMTDLHFGAVDVVFNEKRNEAIVLEINTAPGLEGTTLEVYSEMLQDLSQPFYDEDMEELEVEDF